MSLRDFIKPKKSLDIENEESIEQCVDTFEKNNELYKGKSLTWIVRVTADELDITKDELCEALDQHYGSQEGD